MVITLQPHGIFRVSPSVREQLVKMLITLEPHGIFRVSPSVRPSVAS